MGAFIHPSNGGIPSDGSSKFSQHGPKDCDSIFEKKGCGIANLLGLPVFVEAFSWNGSQAENITNEHAANLMRNVSSSIFDPNLATDTGYDGLDAMATLELFAKRHIGHKGFGSSNHLWPRRIGKCLVVRAAGLPLLPDHLEAL